jgi:hypothetical protein
MKKLGFVAFALFATGLSALHAQSISDKEKHAARIAFANEFLRELGAAYKVQQVATKELALDVSPTDKMMTAIRSSTRIIMDAKTNVGMLSDIHLDERCSGFVDGLRDINETRQSIHQEMIQISMVFLSDQKPDIDYGKLVSRMPQLTAENDSLDETLFKMAPAVFLCLVDDARVNAADNLDHLVLTGAERAQMLRYIRSLFGPALDAKGDQKYIVSAGWVINQGLSMKKYSSADDVAPATSVPNNSPAAAPAAKAPPRSAGAAK